MANVLVQDTSLTAIADAIREKNGSTDTYKPGEMAAAISEISVDSAAVVEELNITNNGTYTAPEGVDGYSPVVVNVPQDGAPPEEALVITGDCEDRFTKDGWNWFINTYGNQITTKDITSCKTMFYNSKNLTSIPFVINLKQGVAVPCNTIFGSSGISYIAGINGTVGDLTSAFNNMKNLKSIPDITCANDTYYSLQSVFSQCEGLEIPPYLINAYPSNCSEIFKNCYRLQEIPEDWVDTWNFNRIHSYNYSSINDIFFNCYSLRKISSIFLSKLHNDTRTSASGKAYYNMFYNCYLLDEINGLPVDGATITSNMFNQTFLYCYRVKNITFAMNEDGTPKTANWKNQTIDLASGVGYVYSSNSDILNYNSGITADKAVNNAADYERLKDDPDWFAGAGMVSYSRYNHDSAVRTINSLPDTSAYLATAGGTNTIKFKGAAGAKTDGGAINTLTEEEIAVAVAKGWNVALV